MAQAIRSDPQRNNDLRALYYRLIRQMAAPALFLCDPEDRIAASVPVMLPARTISMRTR